MKYHNLSKALAAAGMLASLGTASAATLINTYGPSNITATASSTFHATNTAASKTIDASGLTLLTGAHGTSTQQSWMSATNTTIPQLQAEFIQWDLGASYVLDSIQVWNFNDSSRYDSGIKELDIYVSNVVNPGLIGSGNWTQIGTNVTLSKAPGLATYTGVDLETDTGITLPVGAVRYVYFGVNSNHWDGSGPGNGFSQFGAGLSEVQFFQVPEPSTALLGGLGLLALLRRRRA